MSEEKKGWYVLRAISGKENKVKEVLDAEIKMCIRDSVHSGCRFPFRTQR